jgi:eukaryotic-like serine/threonine-protein kinase
MKPERWKRVDALLSAALELNWEQRAAFLAQECAGDEELQRHVQALLKAHQAASSFLETPPSDAAGALAQNHPARSLDDTTVSANLGSSHAFVGRVLSHYRLEQLLGTGGMGLVYRATDLKLGRAVAIKLLSRHLAADEKAKARFLREARAASALDNPNIGVIYEIGEQDNELFIAMALYEGETLKQRLERGAVPLEQGIQLLRELAFGLEAAHGAGIVHRDIKPANVMLTKAGGVKILDFGLAKFASDTAAQTMTQTGQAVGTLLYMSPEQLKGESVDSRTDLWALGIVAYELFSGVCPFKADSHAATAARILNDEPASLAATPGVPDWLADLVAKLLRKNPAGRLQSATDLLNRLNDLSAEGKTPPCGRPALTKATRRSYLLRTLLLAAVALVVSSIVLVGNWRRWFGSGGPPAIRAVAVLPLTNLSGDPGQEYLADGITEELITDLAKISALKVISRTSMMHYKGANKTLPQIARELNVEAVVEGSVQRVGQRIKINAQLIRAATDEHLWAERYERDSQDVLRMEELAAKDIANAIKVNLTPEEKARLASAPRVNPEAHEAYLKGRFHWTKRTDSEGRKAIEYFQRAVEKDPNYALPYDGLADSYLMLAEYSSLPSSDARQKAEQAVTKALQLDPLLAEAHATLANIRDAFDWDWAVAEDEYKRSIELNPSYAEGHAWYSIHLAEMGRTERALAEGRKAQELDPLSPRANIVACWQYYFARQYEEAIAQARKAFELDPNFMPAYWCSGVAHERKREFGEAIAELERAVTLSEGSTMLQSWLALAYAHSGRSDLALKILNQLKELSRRQYVAPHHFAEIYTGLGKLDDAFKWWTKARDEHAFDFLIHLRAWPSNDALRSDPRYGELLRSMRVPQ